MTKRSGGRNKRRLSGNRGERLSGSKGGQQYAGNGDGSALDNTFVQSPPLAIQTASSRVA